MRTDVKLGIITSMVVVLAAGGYFLFRGDSQAPIPIADKTPPTALKTAAKPPVGKQPSTNPSRQVISSKDIPARANLPVNHDPKVAAKPAERPPVTIPKERTPVTQPIAEPFVERAPDPSPPTPINSPAGAVPAVPGVAASGDPDAGHISRTLMAGNEPVKPAPTTPVAESSATPSPAPAPPTVATNPPPSSTPLETKPDLSKAAVDTHRVQPGDSFATLAQTYYGNAKYAKFLAESNPGVSDPARLPLGSTVKVPPLPSDINTRLANAAPAEKAPPAAASGKKTYKVKSGDSFYRIAKDQLGNAERWKELLALNKTLVHGDPTALQPGQTLVLPD